MPSSMRENDNDIQSFVQRTGIKTILDVGTGEGTYSRLLRPLVEVIDGVEVWEPYVDRFDLHSQYDHLWVGDARSVVGETRGHYDLVIFGDILEHMSAEDSLTLWEAGGRLATWVMVSVPIIHYPQGAEEGNPFEIHVQEHMTVEHMREVYGPFNEEWIYNSTGTFLRRFK